MPANYVLLGEVTVGAAGAASVIFSSIPQSGYTDLKIAISARGDYAGLGSSYKLSFNGSASNFSIRALEGAGSGTPSSFTGTQYVGSAVGATATANTFNNAEIYIPNYLSTTNAKSFSVDAVSENNGTEAYADLIAGLWNPGTQAAIYSVGLTPTSGNFVANSTFYLYGLAAVGTTPVIAPFASGGDIIQNDGTYWYHAFLSSGTFTPAKNLTANCLVVAGGAGGGWAGGGGGAGGLLHYASQSLASGTSQTVTVGAGGAAGVTATKTGSNGSNSVFGSLTASVGGGGGAGYDVSNGLSGGSGGGGNNINGSLTIGSGGTGTSGQGNSGGASGNTNNTGYGTGGGGGAGAAGNPGTNSAGGAGGNGVNTYSSWASATSTGANSGYYAGGGGGGVINTGFTAGTGGLGGGGAGKNSAGAAPSGTANTGGGGGAGFNGGPGVNDGGAGGSGIVIVRYLMA